MRSAQWQAVCGFITDSVEALDGKTATMRDIYALVCANNNNCFATWLVNGKPRRMSYRVMRERVAAIAGRLDALLPRDARVVGLHMPNSPEWALIFWALLMTGHSPLLLDSRRPMRLYEDIMRADGVEYAVTADSFARRVEPSALYADIKGADDAPYFDRWSNRVIFVTSGTTGDMRLYAHDGDDLARQFCACRYLYRETLDIVYPRAHGPLRHVAVLPLAHIFGFVISMLWYSVFGKELLFPASAAAADIIHICLSAKATHLSAVPAVYSQLMRAARELANNMFGARADMLLSWLDGKRRAADADEMLKLRAMSLKLRKRLLGNHMRYVISGGAALPANIAAFFNRLGYNFCNGYGMTELGILAVETSGDPETRALGSIGKPLAGVEFITGESGELRVNCAYAAKGRLAGGAIEPLPTPFPTGDCARSGPDARLFILGRGDDIIIDSNGERLHPADIERGFERVEGVAARCAIHSGDKLILVLFANNPPPDASEIARAVAAANSALPLSYRVRGALLCDNAPRNAKYEIDRKAVLSMYKTGALNGVALALADENTAIADELTEGVREEFAEALHINAEGVGHNADFFLELGGDSLAFITMISRVEQRFRVRLDAETRNTMTSVARCAAIVKFAQERNCS